MSACNSPKCQPEAGCDLGEKDFRNCPNWRAASKRSPKSESDSDQEGTVEAVLPWSGNAFGIEALSLVASRSCPSIIAIVGPYNSGKTTLLGSWYLLTSRGRFPEGFQFAGSYTLGGWENVSHSLRWSEDAGPTFPDHTPVGGRYAGMLHLAYRSGNSGDIKDYLFIDAPGEWYQRWSITQDAPNAEGARWIAANADVFLVLADCESLASEDRGEARQSLQFLLDRLGSVLDNRPLALIWSKADKNPSPEMKQAILDATRLASSRFAEFEISIYPENDEQLVSRRFLEVLQWTADRNLRQVRPPSISSLRTDALGPYGRSVRDERP